MCDDITRIKKTWVFISAFGSFISGGFNKVFCRDSIMLWIWANESFNGQILTSYIIEVHAFTITLWLNAFQKIVTKLKWGVFKCNHNHFKFRCSCTETSFSVPLTVSLPFRVWYVLIAHFIYNNNKWKIITSLINNILMH